MADDKRKILIADDDDDLVHILRMRLEAEGFETFAAHEGIRAIEVIHRVIPDLVILDLRMPAGKGQSVLQNLRSNFDTEKIPVIVLSGLDDPEIKEKVLDDGAQLFIKKPCEAEELIEKINSLIPE